MIIIEYIKNNLQFIQEVIFYVQNNLACCVFKSGKPINERCVGCTPLTDGADADATSGTI